MTATGSEPAFDSRQLGFSPDREGEVAERKQRLLEVLDVLEPFADALGVELCEGAYQEHAERIARDFTLPDWPVGRINLVEAAALDLFVRTLKPETVVEVGVASGVSSAALLSALSTVGGGESPRLRSYDIMTHCYFDESRAVGEAVGVMVPHLASDQLLKRGGAKTAGDELAPGSVSFAFIDANHAHPAPVADLIDLGPCLASGAWVMLHDIRLSKAMLERDPGSERQVYGAEVLFEGWEGVKVTGERFASNIGAIRVDEPALLAPENLRHIIDEPWETIADSAHVRRTLGRTPEAP